MDQGPGKRNYLETKRYIKQMYKRTHMGVLSVKLFLMLLSMRDCRADTRIQVGQGDLRNKCPRNSDFRLDYKSTVIKIVWYWQKNRNIDQWNRTENPETNACIYGQLIYDKWDKSIHWRKGRLFNKQSWENWTAKCSQVELEHSLTLYSKINSKWIKDLYVILDTIKLLQGNQGRTVCDINYSSGRKESDKTEQLDWSFLGHLQ